MDGDHHHCRECSPGGGDEVNGTPAHADVDTVPMPLIENNGTQWVDVTWAIPNTSHP